MGLKNRVWIFIIFVACGKKDIPHERAFPKEATVLIDQLRLRITPHTQSSEIIRLEKGDKVKVLARSAEKSRIGKDESYWYEVETKSKIRGWVYGAYLDIEGRKVREIPENLDYMLFKMKDYLIGRWYIEKPQGGLTDNFVTFYPSGQFDIGQGKNIFAKGNYEINLKDTYKAQVTFYPIELKKNPLLEISLELRGETLLVQGKWKDEWSKFQLAEKNPKPLDEESETTP